MLNEFYEAPQRSRSCQCHRHHHAWRLSSSSWIGYDDHLHGPTNGIGTSTGGLGKNKESNCSKISKRQSSLGWFWPTQFGRMNGEEGIEVYRSELHGDGVRAVRRIPKDSMLYMERPRFFLQNLANRSNTLVCSNCARFLGSVGLQFKYLQKLFDRALLSETPEECMGESYQQLSPTFCPCNLRCGEYYCCDECRELHWEMKGHKYMCTGTLCQDNAMESALYKFKSFCVQTNEIFLMIGNMMAEICCYLDQMSEENPVELTKAALTNYDSYVHNLWWDVATLSMKKGSKQKAKLEKSLKGLVKEAASLLRDTLKLKERGLHHILNEELISRTIGMFEQNNIGVRLTNPITTFINSLSEGDERIPELREQVECVYDMIDDEADVCDSEEEYEDVEGEEGEDGEGDEEPESDAESVEDDEGDDSSKTEIEDNNQESTSAEDSEETKKSKKALDQLIEDNGGADTLFPPLDGTGFFMTTCKINHSCDPNVFVQYNQDPYLGLVLELVALKDIEEGEELVQSYIDQNLPTEKRQKALRDYGFQCRCHKCIESSAA